MLTKLLSRNTCASCGKCCHFDGCDIWNTPILNAENRQRILAILPEAQFISKGNCSYLFRIRNFDENGNFICPLLDLRTGCRLGRDKPFECAIWPFCIMELHGRQVITLAPVCEEIAKIPVGILLSFLKEDLAPRIFSYAKDHPDIILPYDTMYPILLWKP